MTRWTAEEHRLLAVLKDRLKEELAASPQYPEVVGERKLVRFLRGHNHDVDKVYGLIKTFLQWRIDNNVNEIRTNIVQNGCDHPLRFPKGDIILKHIPQHIVLPEAMDKFGCPICVEQYNFTPSEVFKHISIEDYIQFVMYSLEYRSLIVEQLSEERERAFLSKLTLEEREELEKPESKPYGVLVNICVIRDLAGVGFAHLSSQGQDIIKTVVNLASHNYPELMRKCFMINTPFLFHTVWYVIRGLLAARTIAKVSVLGSGYMDDLLQEVEHSNLPVMVGGGYQGYVTYTPYAFDQTYLVPDYAVPVATSATATDVAADAISPATVESEATAVMSVTDGTVGSKSSDYAVSPAFTTTSAIILPTTTTVPTSPNSASATDDSSSQPALATDNDAAATDTGRSGSSAGAGASAGANAVTSNGTSAVGAISTQKVRVSARRETEETDFNIISLRTSGY